MKISNPGDLYNAYRKRAGAVKSLYQGATKGLQNYGKNIRKNMEKDSAEFKRNVGKKGYNNYQTKNPFPNPLKKKSYQI